MSAAKAVVVSREDLTKALMGVPSKKSAPKEVSKKKPGKPQARKPGTFLSIENPNYSDADKEEFLTKGVYTPSVRLTPPEKVLFNPAFILNNPDDPVLSGIDAKTLMNLSIFIMNGISEDYITRSIDYLDSLNLTQSVPQSAGIRERFRQDFMTDALYERLSSCTTGKPVSTFSRLARTGICLLGILSDDGILDDVLKEAIELQDSFGMGMMLPLKD